MSVEPSEIGCWRVMRQDDNGVRFEVATYAQRADAAAHLERFESGEYPHHQAYWIEPCA